MLKRFIPAAAGSVLVATLFLAGPAVGQNGETPYWATIDVTEANMRVGPSAEYRIDWVYRRQGLPVRVLRTREGWRLVEDPDGTRGWIAARLLSRTRGGYVTEGDPAEMRDARTADATIKWRLEPGVVGRLGTCEDDWCEFAVGERTGLVRQDRLWGAGEP